MIPSQDVTHQLQALAADESAWPHALRRLAQHIADPTAEVVLALVARDTEQDRALLQRIVAGALDVLCCRTFSVRDCEEAVSEISVLSRTAATRARQLRELASSERSLDHSPRSLLLEVMAGHCENDARVLEALARHLGRHDCELPTAKSGPTNGKAYPVFWLKRGHSMALDPGRLSGSFMRSSATLMRNRMRSSSTTTSARPAATR